MVPESDVVAPERNATTPHGPSRCNCVAYREIGPAAPGPRNVLGCQLCLLESGEGGFAQGNSISGSNRLATTSFQQHSGTGGATAATT